VIPALELPRIDTLDLSPRGDRPPRVLVRVDFNVPIEDGRVVDDMRIRESARTIEWLSRRDATVVLCSHLGRPGGHPDPHLSLSPLIPRLADIFGKSVSLAPLPPSKKASELVENAGAGGIVLLENVRFDPREESGDEGFAAELASLSDFYVNEAFSASHRAHASVTVVPRFLPSAAGYALIHEAQMLSKLFDPAERPYVAVLGGAKVKDKLGVVASLLEKVDKICIGGGMANSFLAALGIDVGAAKVESEHFDTLRQALDSAKDRGKEILLPTDVVAAERFEAGSPHGVFDVDSIPQGWIPLDIGPSTAARFGEAIAAARTVFWNGPMGVFEWEDFASGTFAVAEAVAACDGFTVAGGGDTASALKACGHTADVSHLSTGGGASLEFVRDEDLVGLKALRESEPASRAATAATDPETTAAGGNFSSTRSSTS
jgi:phosphoglycerate kinase